VIIENHIFTRGYATRENIAFYDHSWNKFLSYTNIQQISSIYFCKSDFIIITVDNNRESYRKLVWLAISYLNSFNTQNIGFSNFTPREVIIAGRPCDLIFCRFLLFSKYYALRSIGDHRKNVSQIYQLKP